RRAHGDLALFAVHQNGKVGGHATSLTAYRTQYKRRSSPVAGPLEFLTLCVTEGEIQTAPLLAASEVSQNLINDRRNLGDGFQDRSNFGDAGGDFLERVRGSGELRGEALKGCVVILDDFLHEFALLIVEMFAQGKEL